MPDLSEMCECGHSEENHGAGQNNFCWGGDGYVCKCDGFIGQKIFNKPKPSNFSQVFNGGQVYQVARYWNSIIRRIGTIYGSNYIVGTVSNGSDPTVFIAAEYNGVDGKEKNMKRCWGANTALEDSFSNQIRATWERVKDRVMEIEELSMEVEEITEKIMQRRKLAVESNQLHGGDTGGKIAE